VCVPVSLLYSLFCILSFVFSSPIELDFLRSEYINTVGNAPDSLAKQRDELVNQIAELVKPTQKSELKTSQLKWFSSQEEVKTNQKVCLVTDTFEGITLNSGIGSFYATLANTLAASHQVTVLLTAELNEEEVAKLNAKQKETKNVQFVQLDRTEATMIEASVAMKTSFYVYTFLKSNHFDVVMIPDWQGAAYLSVVAKKDGLYFENTKFVVGLHGPTAWVAGANKGQLSGEVEHEVNFMERKSVEFADAVWAPSTEIYEWVQANQWELPSQTFLLPLPIIRSVQHERKSGEKIEELVFFGRMETRKGLVMFCDAIDLLNAQKVNVKVTFLGSIGKEYINNVDVLTYIQERSAKWTFSTEIISDANREEALNYISVNGRLAVMPSIQDNAPYTVAECLENRIPFVATAIPSIAALVSSKDASRVLSAVSARALSKKLQVAITDGAYIASGSNFENTPAVWASFVDQLAETKTKESVQVEETPLVSICLVHHNRPTLLLQAIESIEQQDYANIEVILVDDGSESPEATSLLEHLEAPFALRKWKIVKTQNQFLGAARNTAVKHANGQFVLFLDDDNYLMPTTVSTYVKVAQNTKADIITAAHLVFYGMEPPSSETAAARLWLPIGASIELGLYKNCFGDANFFVVRQVMIDMPFTEEKELGFEDYEFHAKAALNGGFSQQILPEPLLWYRFHDDNQMILTTDSLMNKLRAMRPYAEKLEIITPLINYLAAGGVVVRASSCGDLICNVTAGENCVNCPTDCSSVCTCPGDPKNPCSGHGTCKLTTRMNMPAAYCQCDSGYSCCDCRHSGSSDGITLETNQNAVVIIEPGFALGLNVHGVYSTNVSFCAQVYSSKDKNLPYWAVAPKSQIGKLSPVSNGGFFLDAFETVMNVPAMHTQLTPIDIAWSPSSKLSSSELQNIVPFYYDVHAKAWLPVETECKNGKVEVDVNNNAVVFQFCSLGCDVQFQMYGPSKVNPHHPPPPPPHHGTTGKTHHGTTGHSHGSTGHSHHGSTGKNHHGSTGKKGSTGKNGSTGHKSTTGKKKSQSNSASQSLMESPSALPTFSEEPIPSSEIPFPSEISSMNSASSLSFNIFVLVASFLFLVFF